MGQRGPSSKPTALRILQGNPGKTKLNPSEPHPAAARPDLPPPAWLTKEAREAWTRLRPDLPWLSVVDLDVLAAYCQTYARWRQCDRFLKANGLTLIVREPSREKGQLGQIKFVQQWPQVAIAQKSLQMMTKLGGELGLSPAARTRIHVEPAKTDSNKNSERMFG